MLTKRMHIEFSQSWDGVLARSESKMYACDIVFMQFCVGIFLVTHPGALLKSSVVREKARVGDSGSESG